MNKAYTDGLHIIMRDQVIPYINTGVIELHTRDLIKQFMKDIIQQYVGENIDPPRMSSILVGVLGMPNLQVVHLMSDIRDLRHDYWGERLPLMRMKKTI